MAQYIEEIKITPEWNTYPEVELWWIHIKLNGSGRNEGGTFAFMRLGNRYRMWNDAITGQGGDMGDHRTLYLCLEKHLPCFLESSRFKIEPSHITLIVEKLEGLKRGEEVVFSFHYHMSTGHPPTRTIGITSKEQAIV